MLPLDMEQYLQTANTILLTLKGKEKLGALKNSNPKLNEGARYERDNKLS